MEFQFLLIIMKKIKILDISDMQNSFTRKEGNLYIKGAQDIITPVNNFLRQIKTGFFDYTLIVLDTHFTEEYNQTEEGDIFPLHCEYGTKDWELSIDTSCLDNKHYLTKNQFNMWGDIKLLDITFNNPERKIAYDNLFYFVDNPYKPIKKTPRDLFIKRICPDANSMSIEVTIIGVASDYCNRYAMEGWLLIGASVTIIRDLTKGIQKETLEILDESKYQQYYHIRLRYVDSTEYLRELTLDDKYS